MAHGVGELAPSFRRADPAELRERMDRDGYLWLRGLLPPEDVAALRADALDVCRWHGWLGTGGDTDNTVVADARCEAPDEAYYETYGEVISLFRFNELAHHRAIV